MSVLFLVQGHVLHTFVVMATILPHLILLPHPTPSQSSSVCNPAREDSSASYSCSKIILPKRNNMLQVILGERDLLEWLFIKIVLIDQSEMWIINYIIIFVWKWYLYRFDTSIVSTAAPYCTFVLNRSNLSSGFSLSSQYILNVTSSFIKFISFVCVSERPITSLWRLVYGPKVWVDEWDTWD